MTDKVSMIAGVFFGLMFGLGGLGSAFFGMVILVAGQLLVEQIYSYTVPVSVFITVFGGIYFLYLLLRERKES